MSWPAPLRLRGADAGLPVDAVGAGQLIFKIPGQGHHADALLVKPAEVFDLPAADGALLDGEERGHFALLHVFYDLSPGEHRADPAAVRLHFPVK